MIRGTVYTGGKYVAFCRVIYGLSSLSESSERRVTCFSMLLLGVTKAPPVQQFQDGPEIDRYAIDVTKNIS